MRKLIVPVLILSLAANVFALAFFLGQRPDPGTRGILADLFPGAGAFSPDFEPRQALNSPEIRPALERLRNARQKVRAAVAATPVNRAALEAAFEEVRAATTELQDVTQQAMVRYFIDEPYER